LAGISIVIQCLAAKEHAHGWQWPRREFLAPLLLRRTLLRNWALKKTVASDRFDGKNFLARQLVVFSQLLFRARLDVEAG